MRYVGMTINSMEERWAQHVTKARLKTPDANSRMLFVEAIREYGPEAFSHEVLEVAEDCYKAAEAEVNWIKKLETATPKGYNRRSVNGVSKPRVFDIHFNLRKLKKLREAIMNDRNLDSTVALEVHAKITDLISCLEDLFQH
jgi:hypothetical protein